MEDKFIKVEDLAGLTVIFRLSDLRRVESYGSYNTLQFVDGSKRQVATSMQTIWSQINSNL